MQTSHQYEAAPNPSTDGIGLSPMLGTNNLTTTHEAVIPTTVDGDEDHDGQISLPVPPNISTTEDADPGAGRAPSADRQSDMPQNGLGVEADAAPRQQIPLPEPGNMPTVRDLTPGVQPPYHMCLLVASAILRAPLRRSGVNEISDWICQTFEYYYRDHEGKPLKKRVQAALYDKRPGFVSDPLRPSHEKWSIKPASQLRHYQEEQKVSHEWAYRVRHRKKQTSAEDM